MTFGKLAEKILGDKTYDFAIPQSIFNEYLEVSNQNPSGHIVWLYDEQSRCGRPYSLTMTGWIILRLHQIKYGR